MKTAFIICGALAREVLDIVQKYEWDADVLAVSARDHVLVERIAPDVEKRILELRDKYDRLIVVFGDCGSGGALDNVLTHHGVERIDGPHCYEMYGGNSFHELMSEELGTYFFTDFLVKGFAGKIMKSMGLDKNPELKEMYFNNYKRVVYLAQNPTSQLLQDAQEAADLLGLPLEVRETGYGLLEERLVTLMAQEGNAGILQAKPIAQNRKVRPIIPKRPKAKRRRRQRR